eukprot:scaffold17154_cov116-Cyclotella_meneghiniana.AAC.2
MMFFELIRVLARALYPSLAHFLRTASVVAGPESLAICSLGYMVMRLVLSVFCKRNAAFMTTSLPVISDCVCSGDPTVDAYPSSDVRVMDLHAGASRIVDTRMIHRRVQFAQANIVKQYFKPR